MQQNAHTLEVSPASLKISFFLAAVKSALQYGAEGWTITNLRQDMVAAIPDC